MDDHELRSYLDAGPCSQELINPIIEWIYHGKSINRCHFEEYVKEFRKSPLLIQQFVYKNLNDISPGEDVKVKLAEKYGTKMNFSDSSITAIFRKADSMAGIFKSNLFKAIIGLKYIFNWLFFNFCFQLLKRFPELKKLARKIIELLSH